MNKFNVIGVLFCFETKTRSSSIMSSMHQHLQCIHLTTYEKICKSTSHMTSLDRQSWKENKTPFLKDPRCTFPNSNPFPSPQITKFLEFEPLRLANLRMERSLTIVAVIVPKSKLWIVKRETMESLWMSINKTIQTSSPTNSTKNIKTSPEPIMVKRNHAQTLTPALRQKQQNLPNTQTNTGSSTMGETIEHTAGRRCCLHRDMVQFGVLVQYDCSTCTPWRYLGTNLAPEEPIPQSGFAGQSRWPPLWQIDQGHVSSAPSHGQTFELWGLTRNAAFTQHHLPGRRWTVLLVQELDWNDAGLPYSCMEYLSLRELLCRRS